MEENEDPPDERGRGEVSPLLAEDEFYLALAARTRRRVLGYLLERDRATVDELAEVLSGWETTPGAPVASDTYPQYHIALHHIHLPHLADVGLVTYDRQEGHVSPANLDDPIGEIVRWSLEAEGG